jgi:hypothetical protein
MVYDMYMLAHDHDLRCTVGWTALLFEFKCIITVLLREDRILDAIVEPRQQGKH